MTSATSSRAQARTGIVEVTARLLQDEGAAAVTTRGVAKAAGFQAPAIYGLFGEQGRPPGDCGRARDDRLRLREERGRARGVRGRRRPARRPARRLERQVDFGVANPSIFRLLSEPERVLRSPAARAGRRVLETRVHRLAMSGRLRVSAAGAVGLVHVAGIGVIQTLLSTPPERCDAGLAEDMQDAVLRQILDGAPGPSQEGATAATVTLRALVPRLDMLSDAEQALLGEWLDRVLERPHQDQSRASSAADASACRRGAVGA